jgi:AAA family ATP:ADP antiporter
MSQTGALPEAERRVRSVLEHALRVFTDVHPGEGPTALRLFASVFLLLSAYYLLKPLRDGWIAVSNVSHLKPIEVRAYTSFGQVLVLLLVTWAYGPLVNRCRRSNLLSRVTSICMVIIVIFWFLQPGLFIANVPAIGIIFYLWVGIFGVFVLAQFWAFVADLYSDAVGRRLMPLVAIGATSGAIAGSEFTRILAHSKIVPTEALLLISLFPLAASMWLARSAEALGPCGPGQASPEPRTHQTEPSASRSGALGLILRSRLLLAVAIMTLLLNWINTNGENLLFGVVQDFLADQARAQGIHTPDALRTFIRAGTSLFYGSFYFWVNTAALVLQCLVASRLLRYGGFGVMLLFSPTMALLSYSTMALVPIFAVVMAMKVFDDANDYSINNTARNVLWLPIPSITKFKTKPAIDSLFLRAGDGFSALTIVVGVQLLHLSNAGLFAFTVALVVIWLLFSLIVVREHARLVAEHSDPPAGGEVPLAARAEPAAFGGGA